MRPGSSNVFNMFFFSFDSFNLFAFKIRRGPFSRVSKRLFYFISTFRIAGCFLLV